VGTDPSTCFSALVAGWAAFVAFCAALLVTLGVLLPWTVIAGIVALVSILLVRRSLRHAVA